MIPRSLALASALAAGALASAVWAQAPAATAWGASVVAVELRSDVPLGDPEEVARLFAVVPGSPLTRDAVRRTLRNVQASGLATEVEVHAVAEPAKPGEPGGVRVIVALWADVQVRAVRLEGELGLPAEDLRRALVVAAGEPLVESRVLRSVYRLQDLYLAQGYAQAVVPVRVTVEPAAKVADVVFTLAAGPRSKIAAIGFGGALGTIPEKEALGALGIEVGAAYSATRVRDASDRLREFLVRKGYRLARVEAVREETAGGQVRLTFPVILGPLVEVRIEGADRKRLEKRGLLPFLDDEGYDEALVVAAIDAIRRDYQEQGHARVRVEKTEERTPDRLLLVLKVDPGPVYRLEEVEFRGNSQVPSSTLARLMTTSPRRLLRPGSGRLIDETLREDLSNLRSYYALQGFANALVGPEEVAERGTELALTVPILEGRSTLVESIAIDGAEELDPGWLRARLPLYDGGPYHPVLLEDALGLVRSDYLDAGFERTQVVPDLTWNEDRSRVAIVLRVFPGRRNRVDRVVLRGNQRTRSDVVRRFVTLRPGEPVSQRDLVGLQSELYRLGIFSRVEVSLGRGGVEEGDRDVIVRVEEGRVRRLVYGVGYDSEDGVSGLAGVSHANLFGRAMSLQVDLRLSEREQQARALFRQPFLGPLLVPVTYSVYRTNERQPGFESKRYGTQVEAERRFGLDRRSRFGLLYTYKIVSLDLLEADADVDRSLSDIKISSLTPSLLLDRRDDPVNPTRGWSAALQLELASPLRVADEAFAKLFAQGTYQRPLGPTVVAASLRLGAIEPFGDDAAPDPTLPARLEAAEIPISERFFAGGRTSHRAYRRDFLGLRGSTLCQRGLVEAEPTCGAAGTSFVPVGGDGLALLNVDFRFPIAGGLGGGVFVDAGNVWPSWQDVNPREAKLGAGVGLRYLTPIGPVRAEIGWKLDRERGESPFEFFLSFGNPF